MSEDERQRKNKGQGQEKHRVTGCIIEDGRKRPKHPRAVFIQVC